MTLRNNDTQSLKLRNKTVQRFAFVLNLIGNGTLANVLLEYINVKAVLRRGGKEYVLFNENLQLLAQESMFFQGYDHALQKTAISISATQKMLPLMVDLGSPVNLKGMDELTMEVTSKTGWYADFDASQSSLEVEDREAIGIEAYIPFIKTFSISATHSRVKESLGDNVTSITLLNTEPARTNSDADCVFQGMIITSDKYSASDNRGRLLSRRASQFTNSSDAILRKESFRYIPNLELHDVEITLELNGGNVAATKNYIVYRSYVVTQEGLSRAQSLANKHANENQSKLNDQLNA